MNQQLSKTTRKPQKDIQEIEDLIAAYTLAQTALLTEKSFLKAHKILSKQLLITSLRGKYRNDKVGVFDEAGLVYLAIEAELLAETMSVFFSEIKQLLATELTAEEVFYHAALLHLRFVHIHPFRDGNGRAARLLEKWFLCQKLGNEFWQIPSEKYYKEHQAAYYAAINIGSNFYELNYQKALPFLTMLPNALR
jgi:Fic family protein